MLDKQKIIIILVFIVIFIAITTLESRKIDRPSSDVQVGGDLEIDFGSLFSNTSNSSDTTLGFSEDRAERIKEKSLKYERAKEVTTPDGFINTSEVKIEDLIGKKVILVDFWTYSCINCQRTLPYLNSWHEKYGDKGLVILGVHTPEFEFEKELFNVQRAVDKFMVNYAVILDNDYSTWTAYKNRYWPRKYIIDIDGFIVYDHIGEGGYEETEKKIVSLLNERSRTLGEEAVAIIDSDVEAESVARFKKITPEIYFGYSRVEYLLNLPSRGCFGSTCDFIKPESITKNAFALSGKWRINEEEASVSEGVGEIIINFSASKVNLVAGSVSGEVKAEILLDGEIINSKYRGSDVNNDGTVIFKTHDLYNLVDLNGDYEEHELIIRVLSPELEVFAFTFG